VVLVAPTEVSFASGDAIRDIYGSGGSGFDKTDFYDLFTVFSRRRVVMPEVTEQAWSFVH
jgi:hypothetical protein